MRKFCICILILFYASHVYAAPIDVGNVLRNVANNKSNSSGSDVCGINNILSDLKSTANSEIQKNLKSIKDETSKRLDDMKSDLTKNITGHIETIKNKVNNEIIEKGKGIIDKVDSQINDVLSYISYLKFVIIVVCIILSLFIMTLFISIFRIKSLLKINKELSEQIKEIERKVDLLFRK